MKRIEKQKRRLIEESNKRILKESAELTELHDEVLYLTPEYRLTGSRGEGVRVYEEIIDTVNSYGIEPSDEAKALIKRLEYDLSALEGFDERVVKLYELLSGININE